MPLTSSLPFPPFSLLTFGSCAFLQLRTYPCGCLHVSNSDLMSCSKQNEEQFIRDYTGKDHTYVLTTMFSFEVLLAQFCDQLEGFLPSDCLVYQQRVNT